MFSWLFYFLIASSVSFTLTGFLIKKRLYRAGGMAIVLAFIVTTLTNQQLELTSQTLALIWGGILILIFGLLDDKFNLSWKIQLAFQLSLGILLILSGYQIDYITAPLNQAGMWRLDQFIWAGVSVFSALLILIWTSGVINAVNWADGIDGLLGGIGLLGCIALTWVSLRPEVNQPAVAILALTLAGSILGFWWWNFPCIKSKIKNKIQAGTSGSYFIAFCLACLAIISGTKIATTLLILAVPLIDALWVIWERFSQKIPLTKKEPFKRHLHYKLRQRGWSDLRIVLSYLLFISAVLTLSLLTDSRIGKIILLTGEVGIILGFLRVIKRN